MPTPALAIFQEFFAGLPPELASELRQHIMDQAGRALHRPPHFNMAYSGLDAVAVNYADGCGGQVALSFTPPDMHTLLLVLGGSTSARIPARS